MNRTKQLELIRRKCIEANQDKPWHMEPVRLADVLCALTKTLAITASTDDVIELYGKVGVAWNLREDDLTAQSDECIQFLCEKIKTQNLVLCDPSTMEQIKINENEQQVLKALAGEYHNEDDWAAFYFRGLVSETKLNLKAVRRACRSLAKKGLAVYERVLWGDEGPAGAGYRASKEGAFLVRSCIDCKTSLASMDDGRCDDCWHDRKCIKCGKPYDEHPLKNGYREEFEFAEQKQEALPL